MRAELGAVGDGGSARITYGDRVPANFRVVSPHYGDVGDMIRSSVERESQRVGQGSFDG
jgi:hypothetical protein